MDEPILQLRKFGVSLGDRVVLTDIHLDVPNRGVTALLGPCGSGKSSLLRTIAGFNRPRPALQTWGKAKFNGHLLDETNCPAMVMQDMKLLTSTVRENVVSAWENRRQMTLLEQKQAVSGLFDSVGLSHLSGRLDANVVQLSLSEQRQVALARVYSSGKPLICVDEPDSRLEDSDAEPILEAMRRAGRDRALLWVTHNQRRARQTSSHVAFLAGGRIFEFTDTERFFTNPQTPEGGMYIQTGGCPVPSPMAKPEELNEDVTPPPPLPRAAQRAIRQARGRGPRDFFWLLPGQLGGLPRPGIINDLNSDLEMVKSTGVTVLVTLEEAPTLDPETLKPFGMKSWFFPIDDMNVPSTERAIEFCREVETLLEQGETIAFHCRAGLGRTGVMLACQLVWRGATPLEALEKARETNARWIQSERQVQFLTEFAEALSEVAART